jgi:hypothetical protein
MKNDQVAVALRPLRDGSTERLVQNAARLARATIVGTATSESTNWLKQGKINHSPAGYLINPRES